MIEFTKMAGAGNDFIVFDNRGGEFGDDIGDFVRRVCTRALSVGADGVILAERSAAADIRMVYWNSDGGRAAFCANGTRCVARYAVLKAFARGPSVRIECDIGPIEAQVLGENLVSLPVPGPFSVELDRPLRMDALVLHGSRAVAGVPHYVLRVENLWAHPIEDFGRKIRNHPDLGPEGVNVDFVHVASPQEVQVRTYERGVERETLSCGSGCIATALVLGAAGAVASPVVLKTRSGIDLIVKWKQAGNEFSDVVLTGDARITFQGFLEREAATGFPLPRRTA